MDELPWRPTFVDVESTFDTFVTTFRGGKRLDACGILIPPAVPNADYVFFEDNVVAELKTLDGNSRDIKVFAKRLCQAYQHCGYSGSDLFGYTMHGKPIKEDVARRLHAAEGRNLIEAIKQGNKQIRATKRLLDTQEARGLILVANDNNLGLTPNAAMLYICKAFRYLENKECHIDAIVFFSPNVYYDDGSNVAKQFWLPIYNIGSESFGDFVNDLGRAWGDFFEKRGSPYLVRTEHDELSNSLASACPIKMFDKKAELK